MLESYRFVSKTVYVFNLFEIQNPGHTWSGFIFYLTLLQKLFSVIFFRSHFSSFAPEILI